MYLDKENCFHLYPTAQAETTTAAHISANVVDLTKYPRNIIDMLYWVFQLEVAITTATSATFQVDLVTSAAEALTAPQILWSSGVVATGVVVAWLAQSTLWAFKVPAYLQHRYMGCIYTIGTGTFTAGSWRSFLSVDVPYLIDPSPLS